MKKNFAMIIAVFALLTAPAFADVNDATEKLFGAQKTNAQVENYRSAREARIQEEREAELFELQKKALQSQIEGESPIAGDPLAGMQEIIDDGRERAEEKNREAIQKEQTEALKKIAANTRDIKDAVE